MAALLTNRVPVIQGGAEVLELSAKDTKTLYYMPTGGVRRLTLSTVKDLENVSLRDTRMITASYFFMLVAAKLVFEFLLSGTIFPTPGVIAW